jgi:hypothetical protein
VLTIQQILAQAQALLKAQLAIIANNEIKDVLPPFVTFFNWVAANPGAALINAGPQLVLLQASVLAAQSTANQADISSLATSLSSNLAALIAAEAAPTPTPAPTPAPAAAEPAKAEAPAEHVTTTDSKAGQ